MLGDLLFFQTYLTEYGSILMTKDLREHKANSESASQLLRAHKFDQQKQSQIISLYRLVYNINYWTIQPILLPSPGLFVCRI